MNNSTALTLEKLGAQAKAAAQILGQAHSSIKDQALHLMAESLLANIKPILAANQLDMHQAQSKNMPAGFLDRLLLTPARITEMAKGLQALIALPDPIGELEKGWYGAQNIFISRVVVPLGVIGIIYEARPNVTVDGAGICLKTGNAVILRGSSDAIQTNLCLGALLAEAAEAAGLPKACIQVLADTTRETATKLMGLNQYIDVLIPRGGSGLIKTVVATATVPVIETGTGNCHIYIDETADLVMAKEILCNAKTQRPSVCNAAESLLIHQNCAKAALQAVAPPLLAAGVEIRGCAQTQTILQELSLPCTAATEEDYATEYEALILSCKIVKDIDRAIAHINQHNTKHSEAIITKNYENAKLFQQQIDAAAVYVNASTRFTDGFQFGFGAEIGISTQKLHARGPMGLKEMTTTKYLIDGNGQVRK